jgi:predicted ArsR family transcriptional regulator
MTSTELARTVRLHGNTARFHLEALASARLVERRPEARTSPGRPRMLYAVSASAPDVGERSYRVLAQILTRHLEGEPSRAAQRAEAAGAAWGRDLASGSRGGAATQEAAAQAVVDGLATVGFDSTAVEETQGRRVDITPCPFLELAETDGRVVCAVHRGLMRGLLEELDAPLRVESLTPFAEPHRCVARLRSA